MVDGVPIVPVPVAPMPIMLARSIITALVILFAPSWK
jgi:hypothetical protein